MSRLLQIFNFINFYGDMTMKKKLLFILMLLAIAGLPAVSRAAVLAYDGFGDGVDGADINGYSGVGAEAGFSAAWVRTGGSIVHDVLTDVQIGIMGGYAPEATGGSEHLTYTGHWSMAYAVRTLTSPVDLSIDGTYYLSFFGRSGGSDDFCAQLGLYNGTNAIMAGQGYSRGLNATWGALTTSCDSGNNQVDISISNGENCFFLIELVKTNSGTTDDLTVIISWWNLTADNVIVFGPEVTRSQSFTGVTGSFNQLAMKQDGWQWMDEVRLADTVQDATGGISQFLPAADEIGGLITGAELSLVNGHFTEPGYNTGSEGWAGVPGWGGLKDFTLDYDTDSGTASGDSTDGDNWYGGNQIDQGPFWNITDANMVEGESYSFTADLHGRYNCDTITMSIIGIDKVTYNAYTSEDPNVLDPNSVGVINDPANVLASIVVDTPDHGVWVLNNVVSYTATAADADKKIGVKFEGLADWMRADNVHFYEGIAEERHGVIDCQPDGSAEIPGQTSVDLTWTPGNDPNTTGQTLYYVVSNSLDVSAYLSAAGIGLSGTVETYNVGTMDYDQYLIWRVDTVIDGVLYTGTTYVVMTESADVTPVVEAGSSYITWLGNLPQTLAGTVDDFGEGDILNAGVVWSIISGPAGSASITKTSTDPLNPAAEFTTDTAGDYVIELAAADDGGSQGAQTGTDTLTIRVARDACAAKQLDDPGYNVFDELGNQNCIVDLPDLAAMAAQWMDDISLTAPVAY